MADPGEIGVVFLGGGLAGREVTGAGDGVVPDTDVVVNHDRGLCPATAAADRRADLDHHNHTRIITGQPDTDQPMQAATRAALRIFSGLKSPL